jgi:hypothetical protein
VAKEKFKVNIKTGSSAQYLLLRIILFPGKKFLNGRAAYPTLSQTLDCAISEMTLSTASMIRCL